MKKFEKHSISSVLLVMVLGAPSLFLGVNMLPTILPAMAGAPTQVQIVMGLMAAMVFVALIAAVCLLFRQVWPLVFSLVFYALQIPIIKTPAMTWNMPFNVQFPLLTDIGGGQAGINLVAVVGWGLSVVALYAAKRQFAR